MADDPAGQETTTYTQEELDKAIKDANAALEAKREELLGETKAAKEAARKSAEALSELQSRVAEMEQDQKAKQAGLTEDKIKEIRAEARAIVEKEYGPKLDRLTEAESEIRTLRLDNVVKGIMGKSGVRADRIDALFRLVGDRFDLTDDGKPILGDNPAQEIPDYFRETVGAEFPEFFDGTGSAGGGSTKTTITPGSVRTIAADDNDALIANLEGVANGTVVVQQ